MMNAVCAAAELSWKKTDETVALLKGTEVVWQLNYRKEEGKPYFHPLCTLSGELITDLRPKDHVWHRGLWFSWKYINEVNYWEEDRRTHKSQGTTELVSTNVVTNDDFSAKFTMKLSYHPPGEAEILAEERVILVSAPDAAGVYRIDWTSKFTATADAELSRTPIRGEKGGKGWGGYAGFSLRMAKAVRGCTFSSDQIPPPGATKKIHGSKANWFAMELPKGKSGGVVMLNAPANLSTTCWYFFPSMPFMSPAVIWEKPHKMAKGDTLTLKYRMLVFDKPLDRAEGCVTGFAE